MIDLTRTERGFAIGTFIDRYGDVCSIQKSSLATEDAIWLGIHEVKGEPARMHLTQSHVADLLPHLQRFVSSGELDPTLIEMAAPGKDPPLEQLEAEVAEMVQRMCPPGCLPTPYQERDVSTLAALVRMARRCVKHDKEAALRDWGDYGNFS